MSLHYHTMLSIAGSDSSAGAGIQADIKAALMAGVYALTVVTAVTAQNSSGVKAVEAVSSDILKRQLEALASDLHPAAVKIGMIPGPEAGEIIAEFLENNDYPNIVIDPVLRSSSGCSLSSSGIMDIYKTRLFPLAALITPNIDEAERITGIRISDPEKMVQAATHIIEEYGAGAVLMKGGHLPSGEATEDILIENTRRGLRTSTFRHPYIRTLNTHGTGCTLSSSIAARLAKGLSLREAVREGVEYTLHAIEMGKDYLFGKAGDAGPLYHLPDPATQ